jgi:hypothetical protein
MPLKENIEFLRKSSGLHAPSMISTQSLLDQYHENMELDIAVLFS